MNLFNEYQLIGKTSFKVNPGGPIDISIPEYYINRGCRIHFAGTIEDFNTFKGYCVSLGYTGSYHHMPVEEDLLNYLYSVPTRYFFSTPSYMNNYINQLFI